MADIVNLLNCARTPIFYTTFFYWLPPNNAKDYGYVQVANEIYDRTKDDSNNVPGV